MAADCAIGGRRLGGELTRSGPAQLGRQCLDDTLELAGVGHLRDFAEPGGRRLVRTCGVNEGHTVA